MSKIVLLGDTHFGARGDSIVFHKHFEKFYSEIFFPYLEENNIKTVIQMGDLFDKRKTINFFTLKRARDYIFDELKKRDIKFHVLLGNHDVFFKNNNFVNSPDLLLKDYDNITLWYSPYELEIGGTLFGIVPWICPENSDRCLDFIQNTKADVLLGHFEISGFEMHRGSKCEHGMSRDIFRRFDKVLSGHFHHRSADKNIYYLGTPYEMTWSDWNDPKGFHTIDTKTQELTFIENPNKIFHKIIYNNGAEELNNLQGTYIKVIVQAKDDEEFAKYITSLENQNPEKLQVIEDSINIEFDGEELEEVENTLDLIKSEIRSADTSVDKYKLETYLSGLYEEALHIEK